MTRFKTSDVEFEGRAIVFAMFLAVWTVPAKADGLTEVQAVVSYLSKANVNFDRTKTLAADFNIVNNARMTSAGHIMLKGEECVVERLSLVDGSPSDRLESVYAISANSCYHLYVDPTGDAQVASLFVKPPDDLAINTVCRLKGLNLLRAASIQNGVLLWELPLQPMIVAKVFDPSARPKLLLDYGTSTERSTGTMQLDPDNYLAVKSFKASTGEIQSQILNSYGDPAFPWVPTSVSMKVKLPDRDAFTEVWSIKNLSGNAGFDRVDTKFFERYKKAYWEMGQAVKGRYTALKVHNEAAVNAVGVSNTTATGLPVISRRDSIMAIAMINAVVITGGLSVYLVRRLKGWHA